MSSNEFNVSPAAILAASTDFGDVGDTAQQIDGNLQAGLAHIDVGDDVYGAAFNRTFLPAITATGQVLLGVSDGMHTTVTNLQNTGNLYTRSNEVNTDLSSNLGRV
jgi:hypothetical protein